MAAYGVTGRLNVIATLPVVSTRATGGTLHGQKGLQDSVIESIQESEVRPTRTDGDDR